MLIRCKAFCRLKEDVLRWLLLVTLLIAGAPAKGGEASLSDYAGTYEYHAGGTVEIVAGRGLFAVLDEAKYALQRVSGDQFRNSSGTPVPFRRAASGEVIGLSEGATYFRKLSAKVRPETAALASPRSGRGTDRYRAPVALDDGLAVGRASGSRLGQPAADKIVAGVLDGTWPDVHSVLIHQGGKLILEEYFYGYGRTRPHQMRSLTKSVVGTLAGAAVNRKVIANVEQTAATLLPYKNFANPDPRKAQVRLVDLLTMRSGLSCDDDDSSSPGNENRIYPAEDWVKAVMDLPMAAAPGTQPHYCSGAVLVAGRIVEKASGQTLPAFAEASLFGPLGLQPGSWKWNFDLTNKNKGFAQVHLRPRDMLKFGLLYAQGGRWNGRQILSEDWVRASLASQAKLRGKDYGYYWWGEKIRVATPAGERVVHASVASGNGGQKIYIVPEADLVAVFTGGAYNAGNSAPNAILPQVILRAILANEAQTN